jgi:hypothetical protein
MAAVQFAGALFRKLSLSSFGFRYSDFEFTPQRALLDARR